MKRYFPLIFVFAVLACKKNGGTSAANSDSKIIESINQARIKYNDSITILNNTNHFGDISGTHQLRYKSDEAEFAGTIKFIKTGRDTYDAVGKAKSGSNKLTVNGVLKRVSEKHLNFDGKIVQTVNGKKFVRSRSTTFYDEGKGKFWRLQDKLNGEGFIDYIDVSF